MRKPSPQTTPDTLEEVVTRIHPHLPRLRERYKIRTMGIFGSYVRGRQRRTSDLDVLVDFNEPPSLLQLACLQRELSQIAGVQVDLVLRDTLKPSIGKAILAEVVEI